MPSDPSHEVLAEVHSAEWRRRSSHAMVARLGASRRCLRCSGPLAVEYVGESYFVRCEHEGRVILTSRGL